MKRLRILGRRRNPRARERISRTVAIRLAGASLATVGIAVIGVGTINTPLFSSKLHLVDSKGDIWVDTATANDKTDSGHETDPHLPCEDINLWGNGLDASSGTFTIYSIPASDVDSGTESAGDDQDWPTSGAATWSYSGSGNKVISDVVISVKTLIANAIANGDVAQAQQGYHFKINFEAATTTDSSTVTTSDDAKSKTFWVDCTPPTTTTTTATVFQPTTTTTTTTTTSTNDHTTTTTKDSTTTTTSTSATTKSATQTLTTTLTTATTSISTVAGAPVTVTMAGPTVTNNVTVAAPTTVLAPTTLTVTTGNPAAPTSSATPSSGVAGAATPGTPSTGLDIAFGSGIALLVSGGSLVLAAPRLGRRKNK